MSLRNLIRGHSENQSLTPATATVATLATDRAEFGRSVATVASVAVAATKNQKVEATWSARLQLPEAVAIVDHAFADVARWYLLGALGELDADPPLLQRFRLTEDAIDRAALAGREAELRVSLTSHVAVIRECCDRLRARRERAA